MARQSTIAVGTESSDGASEGAAAAPTLAEIGAAAATAERHEWPSIIASLRAWRATRQGWFDERLKENVAARLHMSEIRAVLNGVIKQVEKQNSHEEQVATVLYSVISRVEKMATRDRKVSSPPARVLCLGLGHIGHQGLGIKLTLSVNVHRQGISGSVPRTVESFLSTGCEV